MRKTPCSEGSIFLVPLPTGGYARGVVARSSQRILFGYFFGPGFSRAEDVHLQGLTPDAAILKARFGDLGLVEGTWKIIGKLIEWDRSQWPMPSFVRRDPLGRLKPQLVRYSDKDPAQVEAVDVVESGAGLITDSLFGSGAIEITMAQILQCSPQNSSLVK